MFFVLLRCSYLRANFLTIDDSDDSWQLSSPRPSHCSINSVSVNLYIIYILYIDWNISKSFLISDHVPPDDTVICHHCHRLGCRAIWNSWRSLMNIIYKQSSIILVLSENYPFSYFPAWELLLPSKQTVTFKPANSPSLNSLILNYIPKCLFIANILYICSRSAASRDSF